MDAGACGTRCGHCPGVQVARRRCKYLFSCSIVTVLSSWHAGEFHAELLTLATMLSVPYGLFGLQQVPCAQVEGMYETAAMYNVLTIVAGNRSLLVCGEGRIEFQFFLTLGA